MAWISLRDRLAALPLVLAGPILRQTQPDAVTVWVALQEPATVTLSIYDHRVLANNVSVAPLLRGSQPTIPIGAHLHLAAITALPVSTSALAPSTLYYYDMVFARQTGTLTLRDGGVISSELQATAPITFQGQALPSFALPPSDLAKLRIIHGSCRKPHGMSLDAMPALEQMINDDLNNPDNRPHQLFLAGDQIYADDVADPLLCMLSDASTVLLDWTETLPGVADGQVPRAGARTDLVQNIAKFTSTELSSWKSAKSHLLSFGEFAMMYLFVWSDVLWDSTLPNYDQVYSGAGRTLKVVEFSDEVAALRSFRSGLNSVRRALANVPTYMICDDHEITDDWYIMRGWYADVIRSPLGRRIIQNGLLAFALFQAWGNTPDRFKAGAGAGNVLLEAIGQIGLRRSDATDLRRDIAYSLGVPFDQNEANTFIGDLNRRRVNSRFAGRPWSQPVRWDYTVIGPGYEVIVLDTRTWRGYRGTAVESPALLSAEALNAQITQAPQPSAQITLVVSAAPVVGVPFAEDAVRTMAVNRGMRLFLDAEAWSFQSYAFERLLARLAGRAVSGSPHRIVWLSGDVHYGFAARLQYWADRPFEDQQTSSISLVFAQLTASAFKNQEPTLTMRLHSAGYVPGLDTLPETVVVRGWNNPHPGQPIEIGTLSIPQAIFPVRWFTSPGNPALARSDVLLPGAIPQLDRTPEWRYRIDYQRALFEIDEAFQPVSPEAPPPDRLRALQAYLGAAANHQDYAQRWGDGKEIVGLNNFGEIRFRRLTGEDIAVEQYLWWRLTRALVPNAPLSLFPLSKFVVPLTLADPQYPAP